MYNFKITNIIQLKTVNEAGVQTSCFGWQNVGAADLKELYNVGLTLGQRRQSDHGDRKKK